MLHETSKERQQLRRAVNGRAVSKGRQPRAAARRMVSTKPWGIFFTFFQFFRLAAAVNGRFRDLRRESFGRVTSRILADLRPPQFQKTGKRWKKKVRRTIADTRLTRSKSTCGRRKSQKVEKSKEKN